MHSHQIHILRQLMAESPRRYSELKPSDVEGNIFMYHLRKLIRDGYLEKQNLLYGLTLKGKHYVDTLSSQNYQPRIQPKIVTDIACQNESGEWLLFQRRKQPFAGLIGFPSGKIHLGETIYQAAERELKDKTGYQAELVHRGEIYVTVYRDGNLENHVLVHAFSGKIIGGELRAESELGAAFWSKVDNLGGSEYFPGFTQLVDLLKKRGERFFEEYVFDL